MSLPIYPVRYMPDTDKTLKHSLQSGESFQRYISTRQLSYQGWALQRLQGTSAGVDRGYISSNVIIDHKETFRTIPEWHVLNYSGYYNFTIPKEILEMTSGAVWEMGRRRVVRGREIKPIWRFTNPQIHCRMLSTYHQKHNLIISEGAKQEEQGLKNEELVLLPRRLFAYALQDRKFVILDTDNLKLPKSSGNPFNDLVIHASQKDMVRSLVFSHFKKKEMEQEHGFYVVSQDIISNKGRGLVILLHGVPGVGKSSTAEAVAQKWRKPLFAITCGDLGLEAAEFERSLKEIFRLAQLWDCVLLLDEADVFLSRRHLSGLRRKALVSVFLRVLEYYSGIFFLTTNRVGNLDEAFKSRLHMNIERLRATEEEQSQMTGDPMPIIDKDDILNYAVNHFSRSKGHEKWNGRQIRSAFLTAAALARYEWHDRTENRTANSPPPIFEITARHFDTVAKTGAGFELYLQQAKGKSDDELAYDHGIRADYLTKPNQLHTPAKQPPDNLHCGYPQPQPPHVPCQDMNLEQPTFNSPGYRHNPLPGPWKPDVYYGHTDHLNSPPDTYPQVRIPRHQFSVSRSTDEFTLAPNSGMFTGQPPPPVEVENPGAVVLSPRPTEMSEFD